MKLLQFLSFLAFILLSGTGLSQNTYSVAISNDSLLLLNVKEFDELIDEFIAKNNLIKTREKPTVLEEWVLFRLKNFKGISEDAIWKVKGLWESHDRSIWGDKISYTLSSHENMGTWIYLDRVINNLYKNETLKIKLENEKITIANMHLGAGYNNPISNKIKILSLLDSLRFEYHHKYDELCINIAHEYLRDKNKTQAEHYLLQTQSHLFYHEKTREREDKTAQLYKAAGSKILHIRRGNLAMLERTFFIPGMTYYFVIKIL